MVGYWIANFWLVNGWSFDGKFWANAGQYQRQHIVTKYRLNDGIVFTQWIKAYKYGGLLMIK